MRGLHALVVLIAMNAVHVAAAGDTVRLPLNGSWMFRSDPKREGIDRKWWTGTPAAPFWTPVDIPAFWESYPGMAAYDGWGWFSRIITLDSVSKPLSLHCAGVDDDAVVWVNGIELGGHTGYSDPFALEISRALRIGENRITILVKDYGGGGGIYRPITLIDTHHVDELLKGVYFGTPARPSEPWVKDAVIYSAYVRSASREGTFAGLERRLPELKRLGVTLLWLLPIHPIGAVKRKGRLGSPYSVRDFRGINSEFGTLEDFRRLLAAVHGQGMKLIIDLVANHTSWDSRLMTEHPEWFTRNGAGEIVSPNADWTDVADLDYTRAGLREEMIDMMEYWVRDVGIDGFRCDVAELVPTDFWEAARERLEAIKPVMMLSEGSLPEHHAKAFDITYSWNVYDALAPLVAGKRPVALLDQIFRNEHWQFPDGALRMRFVTNHDKNAWDAPAVLKFGRQGLKLGVVLTNTIPGIPMVYTGEEVANNRRLSLFEKVGVNWSRPRTMAVLYRRLASLRRDHPALRYGPMVRIPSSDEEYTYAFLRTHGSDLVLVVLNFLRRRNEIHLAFPAGSMPDHAAFTEAFTGESLARSGVGATVILRGLGYAVYTLRNPVGPPR